MIDPKCPTCGSDAKLLASVSYPIAPHAIRALLSCDKCGTFSRVYNGRYTFG
jgi:uncharacterized Zn finger protein